MYKQFFFNHLTRKKNKNIVTMDRAEFICFAYKLDTIFKL